MGIFLTAVESRACALCRSEVTDSDKNQSTLSNMAGKDISHPLPAIAVSAIILDANNRVLLVRRGQPPAMNLWHAPGGKLEPGESMVQACRREIREETGIEGIRMVSLIAVVERRLEGFHYVILDFLAELPGQVAPDPIAGDDVTDAQWITYPELDHYPLAEGLLPILEKVRISRFAEGKRGLCDYDGNGTDFIPHF